MEYGLIFSYFKSKMTSNASMVVFKRESLKVGFTGTVNFD